MKDCNHRRWKQELKRQISEHVHQQVHAHLHEHRQRFAHHFRQPWHEWPHRRFKRYYGSHLHRRIFLWFVASIFSTMLLVGVVGWIARATFAHSPPRGFVYFGLTALALFLVSGKIARRLARPLDELARVATELGRGNLAARATESCIAHDEIGTLARSVNDMAARIERQIAGQRELLAAVSHELRTPLARLRVLTDIARERGADERLYTEWERELAEMDQLVGELLASARLEFQAVNRSPLDAVDVARRALERAGEPAARLDAAGPSVRFGADPTLIGRALANLLENARKHGGGLRRLAVTTPPGRVVFAVEDAGPGIPAELAERVFQPFVQANGNGHANGATDPTGHSSLGLGLALVARIARAHDGRVAAERIPSGGARLVLDLPTAL